MGQQNQKKVEKVAPGAGREGRRLEAAQRKELQDKGMCENRSTGAAADFFRVGRGRVQALLRLEVSVRSQVE